MTIVMSKKEKLQKIVDKIRRQKGLETTKLSLGGLEDHLIVPTPFATLNALLGVGGFPRGKFGTIAGPSQTAKTTLLLQTIAYNQQINDDFTVLWTDAEGAWDNTWATTLGVDLSRTIIQEYDEINCPTADRLLQVGLDIVRSQAIDMWIVDSVGGLLPKEEHAKNMEEDTMAQTARLMGKFFRKTIGSISSNPSADYIGTACVLIGQVYNVIGTLYAGISEVRGGNALKHWAYWRLMTRRGNKDETVPASKKMQPDGEVRSTPTAWAQHIKLEKTKMGVREGQEVILQFILGRGLDSVQASIASLLAHEIIERRGGWYYHSLLPDGKIQGRPALEDLLREDEETRSKLLSLLDTTLTEQKLEPITEQEE